MSTASDFELHAKKAAALFAKMQQVVEDVERPVMESYERDFYEHDRASMSEHFAPNSRFLWLLHPNGSHLGRVGVVPDKRDMMQAVLKSYVSAHPMRKMALYAIHVDGQGESKIKSISFETGHEMVRKKDYQMVSDTLMRGNEKIANIDVQLVGAGPGQYHGHAKIDSLQSTPLSREQMIAAVMNASAVLTDKVGSLFSALKKVTIDGQDLDVALPSLSIAPLVKGAFKPADVADMLDQAVQSEALEYASPKG
jgi:hypothetical protein